MGVDSLGSGASREQLPMRRESCKVANEVSFATKRHSGGTFFSPTTYTNACPEARRACINITIMASRADKLELDQAAPVVSTSSEPGLDADNATMSGQEKAEPLAKIDDNDNDNAAPFDNKLLLALLGVPGPETESNTGGDESQQAAAHSYITEMFLPCKFDSSV